MPLHESPMQKCGSDHWLTEPCPRGECELMEFRGRDLVPVRPATKTDRLEIARGAVEDAVKREALTAAEKQRRYRERQKLKRLEAEG